MKACGHRGIWRNALLCGFLALLTILDGSCDRSSKVSAAVATPVAVPQLVTQAGGLKILQVTGAEIPGLTTAEVTQIQLPGMLEASGQVAFDDQRVSTIVSRVAGRIDATRVSQWDNVRRGEQIVALYSPDFMTAEAEYLQAQTTVKLLSAHGPATPATAADGEDLGASMVLAARRKLELLGMEEADIATLHAPSPTVWMRAPISGTVVENKAVRGAAVNPGDVLYSLGTLSDVWIVANVYEDDLARVRVGQALEAVTTAYPEQTFSGFISRISPGVDPNTHTLQIRCEVNNPGGRLKPEMLARVRIVTNPGYALVVPMESLVFDTNDYYVYVDLGRGKFERRRVEIGSWKEQGSARLLSGLKVGERVVVGESIQVNALWHQANGESS